MAIRRDIFIDQGADYRTFLNISDDLGDNIDITDYQFSGSIRKHPASNTAYNFTCTVDPIANSGMLTLAMSANTSANIVPGKYYYDIKMETDVGKIIRITEGLAFINGAVTK